MRLLSSTFSCFLLGLLYIGAGRDEWLVVSLDFFTNGSRIGDAVHRQVFVTEALDFCR